MPRLTPAKRQRAAGRFKAGGDTEAGADALNMHMSTVYHLQQCFADTGSTAVMQRSGIPRSTSIRQDHQILRQRIRNRFHTATDTARKIIGNHQSPIGGQTAR
ncbi:hypothetical protein V1264_018737 [Littorina saxatilis]|uniref:Uncharacterized protein n=1 Tax=Littorina saxatilis TaxID=31220 RepID=A0AAN9BEY7_9CAEN